MQKVLTLYHRMNGLWSGDKYRQLLQQLPPVIQKTVAPYIFQEDKQRVITGKLLLQQLFDRFDIGAGSIQYLRYNQYGRPWIIRGFDFNISHSENLVVVSAGENFTLGVDVEAVKPTVLSDFRDSMAKKQWHIILESKDQTTAFYRFWTAREATLKAKGTGLSFPLTGIETDFNTMIVESRIWYLQELSLIPGYMGFLASDKPVNEYEHSIDEIFF